MPTPTTDADLFKYRARLRPWGLHGLDTWDVTGSSWHDGDTFNAIVSMGARGYDLFHIRPAGYDAPELEGATKPAAIKARDYAASLVDTGGIVYLDSQAFWASHEEDNFARMLARVTLPDGRDLTELMIGSGHAVPM